MAGVSTAVRPWRIRLTVLVGAGALLAGLTPRALPAAGAAVDVGAPIVIRDVEAGRDVLGRHRGPEQADTAIEPSIAVNPTNPLNAVAVYQIGRVDGGGDADNGFATTFDGGQTWISGALPGLTHNVGGVWDRASDAVVAFGPDGTVYANSLVFDDVTNNALRSGIANNVSRDGGRTWSAPIVLQDDQGAGLNDKNWIVVDQSDAPGHHQGRVYVVWDRVVPVIANYSDDHGATWLPVFSVVYPGTGIGSMPMVLPDGSLAVVFATDFNILPPLHPTATDDAGSLVKIGGSSLVMAVAPVAGSTPTGLPLVFLPPVTISSYENNPVRAQRAATLPTADVDPKTGQIYVSWEDGRFRRDKANDIVISSSADHITFTPPVRVNPGAINDNIDRWNSALAVGPDGSVRLAYRQRQEAADEKDFSPFVDTFFQQSIDTGKTFTAPLPVNRVRTNVGFAAFSRHGAFLGDYNQVAAAGPLTYVVRDEAYPARTGQRSKLDFKVGHQHQTTWVAVVGTASPTGPVAAPAAAGTAHAQVAAARARHALPATGANTDLRPAVLLVLALAIGWLGTGRRRRRGSVIS